MKKLICDKGIYLLPKAKRLKTQENCKQNRNSLAKRVHKEKKVFKKTFCQSQIFFDASFFDRKIIKASYKKREDNLIHEYKSESNLQGISEQFVRSNSALLRL